MATELAQTMNEAMLVTAAQRALPDAYTDSAGNVYRMHGWRVVLLGSSWKEIGLKMLAQTSGGNA